MHFKRKNEEPDSPQRLIPSAPKHYSCPEGPAQIDVEGRPKGIHVLLDSGASCFLLSERLVERLDIPYKIRRKPIRIVRFDGLSSSSGGKRYTLPIRLEIGNGHRSPISAEIVPRGRFDLIIPFGWWYHKHHLSHLDEPKKWSFGQGSCHDHVKYEAARDLFEYNETVAYDPKTQYLGRIGRVEEKEPVELETLVREYAHFKHLFRPEALEKMPPRQTFDHAMDLKEGSEPPWRPVHPMSQYQLNTLKAYLDEMLAQGKITHSQCNDPTIGSYNNYHLSPNGMPSGNQRWYGLVYLVYT